MGHTLFTRTHQSTPTPIRGYKGVVRVKHKVVWEGPLRETELEAHVDADRAETMYSHKSGVNTTVKPVYGKGKWK